MLGPDFFLDGTEGHLRVGDTPWHAATNFTEDVRFIKVAIYPDPLTKDTGCLRVIPGSHRRESPDHLESLRNGEASGDAGPFGLTPEEIPCVPLETEPGDVLVFPETLLHGAFGGEHGRLQICASFFADPTTEWQVEQIVEEYRRSRFSLRPTETYIHSDRPRIRRMVSRLQELGFEKLNV